MSLSGLGGRISKQIILITFVETPENPIPSMTAPMYLKGNIATNPKIPPWQKADPTPSRMIRIETKMSESVKGSIRATKGMISVMQRIKENDPTILIVRLMRFANYTDTMVRTKLGPLRSTPNKNAGSYPGCAS